MFMPNCEFLLFKLPLELSFDSIEPVLLFSKKPSHFTPDSLEMNFELFTMLFCMLNPEVPREVLLLNSCRGVVVLVRGDGIEISETSG